MKPSQKELNNNKELKLRSDAINRLIQSHDAELIEFSEEIERYRRIIMNLVATLVLLFIVSAVGIYYEHTKANDKVEIVAPTSKDNAYVLRRNK